MRDPHVETLTYRFHSDRNRIFKDPSPVAGAQPSFGYRLADNILTITMGEHFANVKDARYHVELFLRAWELMHALGNGRSPMWFTFLDSEIIDRDPPGPGELDHVVVDAELAISWTAHTPTLTTGRYPEPPNDIVVSPEVEAMWTRFQMFVDGKELLLNMAYFCLSLMEGTTGATTGARDKVCMKYSIEKAVRNKLGDLTSEAGDTTEARKFNATATGRRLSEKERMWVQQVVLALIKRKAQYDHSPTGSFPLITMSDFVAI